MSDACQVEVVIFAKEPVPGRVKTRLQPELSAQQSVTLYRAFLRDVLELVGGWCGVRATSRATLAWSGGADDELFALADDLSMAVVDQGEGDLGARMRRAVEGARDRGAERVIVVGTDSPTLSEEHLDLTLQVLGRCDVVWGPSFDGGYYLVGIATDEASRQRPAEGVIFEKIRWSSEVVLAQSWERATDAGLLSDLLGFWYDVDTFEDVKKLEFHLLDYLKRQGFNGARHTREVLLAWRRDGPLSQ